MNKITNVTYHFDETLSVHSICEVNRSFDKGVLRIAYHGKNRNGTRISKEVFEAALPSLANVPVVTHYLRKTDELGGHDMELVTGDDGKMYMVYVTEPVGVVPSSPNCWWEEVEETNGDVHEYLHVEVLLWKRQEAYKLIKESGVVGQSMEITINDGHDSDDAYDIDSFIFTALCLLGDKHEPCFESASLNVFGLSSFAAQYQEMLNEFKLAFANASGANPVQGGDEPMNNELEINSVEEVEVEVDEVVETPEESVETCVETSETAEETFEETENSDENEESEKVEEVVENEDESNTEENPAEETEEAFSLTMVDKLNAIRDAVHAHESFVDPWGYECARYCFVDVQDSEAIFYDAKENWVLMGAPVVESGDKVEIDFAQMKRKKVSYVDFMEQDVANEWLNEMFSVLNERLVSANSLSELQSQYDELNSKYVVLYEAEQNRLNAEHKAAIAEVIEKFEKMLGGDAEFEALKTVDHESAAALEDKCFSIYGRKKAVFTVADKKQKNVTLTIDACHDEEKTSHPYGKYFAWKENK